MYDPYYSTSQCSLLLFAAFCEFGLYKWHYYYYYYYIIIQRALIKLILHVTFTAFHSWQFMYIISTLFNSFFAECSRDKPPFSIDNVGHVRVLPQGHRLVSVSRQCPCSVWKRFSQGRSKAFWGRTLGESWPPEPTSSYASIDFWCQLVVSTATADSWMSTLDWVSDRSEWSIMNHVLQTAV